jgi:hypothetical protein
MTKGPARAVALSLCVLAAAATPAAARPASQGFFTEAGVGATGVLPPSQDHAAPGPAMSIRIGYDLFRWLSVGVHASTSSHEATVPAPPEGEWFQLYRAHADGRLGARWGAVGLFVEGGAGVAYISSNVLGKVMVTDPGEDLALAFQAGGGLEYQLLNRHYAVGVAGDWFLIPQFAALGGVEARVFLRYTY